jgi:hypothetical protein
MFREKARKELPVDGCRLHVEMVKNSQKLYRFFTAFHFGDRKKVSES